MSKADLNLPQGQHDRAVTPTNGSWVLSDDGAAMMHADLVAGLADLRDGERPFHLFHRYGMGVHPPARVFVEAICTGNDPATLRAVARRTKAPEGWWGVAEGIIDSRALRLNSLNSCMDGDLARAFAAAIRTGNHAGTLQALSDGTKRWVASSEQDEQRRLDLLKKAAGVLNAAR